MIFLSMLLIGSLFSLTVLFTYFYFRYHQPSRNRMESDRLSLVEYLDRTVADLKPWPPEESALLSGLPYPSPRRLGWKDRHGGVLKTIRDEAVVAWACLHYKSNRPHYLLVFRISGEEQPYALRIRDGLAFLFEGQRHVASIEPDGSWTNPRRRSMIGQLRKDQGDDHVLYLGGRMAAILRCPAPPDHPQPRLFRWLEPLPPDQARWTRIMGVCWLILRQERIPWPH